MRYILSIRGGGIRGIIPACCLMKLESQLGGENRDHIPPCPGPSPEDLPPACGLMKLESQLGGKTRDHIAYCAGTSTGALLTAAIAAGIPAADILKVYTDRSKEIFTPTGIIADAKRVAEGFMYDPIHLRDVLVSVFGPAASWVVNDCPIGVMISATAMNGDRK